MRSPVIARPVACFAFVQSLGVGASRPHPWPGPKRVTVGTVLERLHVGEEHPLRGLWSWEASGRSQIGPRD